MLDDVGPAGLGRYFSLTSNNRICAPSFASSELRL